MNIYIVPHSHTDPGWLETYEDYYMQQVKDILTNIINELKMDRLKTFAWAETCFLRRFYEELNSQDQEIFYYLLE